MYPLDFYSSSSFIGPLNGHNVDYELSSLRREVTTFCQVIQDQSDRATKQMDHMFQEVFSLQRALGKQARHRDT